MQIINSFWFGNQLGAIEEICLLSFMHQGHKVRLFCYEKVRNVPDGVELCDARDILPREKFRLHVSGNPALGANQFRYLMMRQNLGPWLDLDVLLLRPFRFAESLAYIFGLEDQNSINNAVLYLPPDAAITQDLCDYVTQDYPVPPNFSEEEQAYYRSQIEAGTPVPVSEMRWGVYGPQALTYFARKHGLFASAQPPTVFYPVYWDQPHLPLTAGCEQQVEQHITEQTIALHLWNSQLRFPWPLRPNQPEGILLIEQNSFIDLYAKRELGYFIRDAVHPNWRLRNPSRPAQPSVAYSKNQTEDNIKKREASSAVNEPLAPRPSGRPLITLNMICKNEEDRIGKCLESVKPFIDQWVIAIDRGSGDDTQAIILKVLADIPGKLYTHDWFDFATNRNMAIECAERFCMVGDYIFFMDADDELIAPDGFCWPKLTASIYYAGLYGENDKVAFDRPIMVKVGDGWRYKYRIHEALHHDNYRNLTHDKINDIRIIHRQAGTRSKVPCRFLHDAFLLEQDLLEMPDEPRCMFYLARSYQTAGLYESALDRYQRRAKLKTGYQDERFISLLRIAEIKHQHLGISWPIVMADYLTAWEFMPYRVEPLARIIDYYANLGGHDQLVALYGQIAIKMKIPEGALFVETDLYEYRMKDRMAVALYWCQRYQEAIALNEQLLSEGKVPTSYHKRIRHNLQECRKALGITSPEQIDP